MCIRDSNKSALKYIDYAYEETEKWMLKRVVREVFTQPTCVSPLTVACRVLGEAEKLRLCLDLSRYINKLLKKEAVRLSGIDKCTQNLLPGDFMGTYDLKSAFHHVKIFEEHQQYLGFALPGRKPGEKERFFVFMVMPFGLASAVKCITRITKPLCGYISSKGIRHSIYIDDGNVLARALAIVIAHLAFVLDALRQAGFVISEDKTDSADTVSQIKLYLGFVVDSRTMTLRITEEKLRDVRQALEVVTKAEGSVRAKRVAKAIGKLIAAEPALGPTVQLLSRAAQSELAAATEQAGWGAQLQLSTQAKQSLQEMSNSLEYFNGYPIKNVATAKKLDCYIEPSKETKDKEAPTQMLRVQDMTNVTTVVGDASAVATCAMSVNEESLFTQYRLTEDERAFSSGQRELITVLRALEQEHEFFDALKNQTVICITDSTNLVSFLTKGTTKQRIQEQVLQVYKLLKQYQIRVVPIHLRRTDFRIQWADEGSREFDPDDWGVDRGSFRSLTKKWQPTVDLFAHTTNAKVNFFYSYGKAPKTAGVDAFAQNWKDEVAWACPPVHLITETIKKVESTKMMAIVVVPAWKSCSFWATIFPNGTHAVASCCHIERFRPHVVRGKYCDNKLMQGKTNFPFLALYFRSKGEGHKHECGNCAYPEER